MIKCIVVTLIGPCIVPKKTYDRIIAKKAEDERWGDQVLFTLRINDAESFDFQITGGNVPAVNGFEEFEHSYIDMTRCPFCGSSAGRRNIII